MEEVESSSVSRKRILFILLFIVPFLVGMALIFMGKGIGTLPVLHSVSVEGDDSVSYYNVPDLSVRDFHGEEMIISSKESAIKLYCIFSREELAEWPKHLMYISKILSRYKNAKVYSIYEGEYNENDWNESPENFVASHQNWTGYFTTDNEFGAVVSGLKLERDSLSNIYPYVIVDKENHIRAYCPINDLKVARDVPNMLKILNNQYVPRRQKIEKRDEGI